MDLSIIILNYKTKNLLKQCVRNILISEPKMQYEIIIVDNASGDSSVDFVKEEMPDVRLIESDRNRGFGGGHNLGFNAARGRYILTLNPDIVVLDDAITKLYEFMERNPKTALLGPKLLNPDGTTQYSCYRLPKIITPLYKRTSLGKLPFGQKELSRYLMMDYDHKTPRKVAWLLGASLMIRKEALDQVGGFDERYFLYCEDIDLARTFWKQGFEVWYYPEAQMFHYHKRLSASNGFFESLTNKTTWIHLASHLKYFQKWGL